VTISRRELLYTFSTDRHHPPAIYPAVERDADGHLLCYGDQHRASLQVGESRLAPAAVAKRGLKAAAKAVEVAETARITAWLRANLKAIARTFTLTDVLPLIAPDVFLDSSHPQRRRLMVARALQNADFIRTAKDSKTAVWCRKADLGKVTRISKAGRRMLIDVPESLRPMRARIHARAVAKLARMRARPVTGAWASVETSDAVRAHINAGARARQRRYRDRKAGRSIKPYRDGRRSNKFPSLGNITSI
jgi:hypothetical protein